MVNFNLFKLIGIFSFLIIFIMQSVYALGVTPARTTIDFSPGLEKEISFSVINSEKIDAELVIYAQGDLNQSILLTQNSLSISSSEASKQLNYKVRLPNNLEPGVHKTEIVVLQLPKKSSTSEAFVGAAVAVATQLYVYVPYPDKYAEADMNIINAEQGKEAVFIIPIINRGSLGIARARANIDIYNKLNEKVASFVTEEISLEKGEKKDIVAKWNANVPVGNYRAAATVIYDEKTISLEKHFSVGSAVLELQQVEVNNFILGQIGKFEMLVENKWSEPIRGAYVQTHVFDKQNKIMADFKSPSYDIEPLKKIVMVSYWDTAGVEKGTYDASIFLKFGDNSQRKDVKFKISENKIETIGLGYVISEARGQRGSSNNLIIILIVAIVVLVLLNLTWFLVLRRYISKKSQKG